MTSPATDMPSREQIERNALFYESYARTVENDITAADGDQALLDLRLEAASTWAEVARWRALLSRLDPTTGLSSMETALRNAGAAYSLAGHGYGTFLMSAAGALSAERSDTVFSLAADLHAAVVEGHPRSDALGHPQQQVYLYLALAALAPSDPRLLTVSESVPHVTGNLPVGPLGVPIRTLWACGTALLHGEYVGAVLQPFRSAFDARYTAAIQSAHVNSYLWDHGAAPVDVVDLDAVGIVSLATQRFGPGQMDLAMVDMPGGLRMLAEIGAELGSHP